MWIAVQVMLTLKAVSITFIPHGQQWSWDTNNVSLTETFDTTLYLLSWAVYGATTILCLVWLNITRICEPVRRLTIYFAYAAVIFVEALVRVVWLHVVALTCDADVLIIICIYLVSLVPSVLSLAVFGL